MTLRIFLAILCACAVHFLHAQQATTARKDTADIFTRLTASMKAYKPDTSAAPNDKLTRAITALRNLKGGFNINEAIDFKIEEDRQKGDLSGADGDKLAGFFQTGRGRKWLDNAVIHIYRQLFTYREVKGMVRFYKTPAGQKMAATAPLVMLQSLMAAEMIKAAQGTAGTGNR